MTFSFIRALAALFILSISSALPALGGIASAVAVQPGASIKSGWEVSPLKTGMEIAEGDEIITDAKGQVQLVFADKTRIAVGPNSRFKVDKMVMRNQSSASRFAVRAVSGSFRFITGNSDKTAYEIRTPTATMGIRGTVFDVSVDSDKQTSLVLLRGKVRMCGTSQRCAEVSGSCAIAKSRPGGAIDAPASQLEASNTLRDGFPFLASQKALQRQFRADLAGCDKHALPRRETRLAPALTPVVEPEPEPEPEPEDPTTPDDTSGGFPGSSGDTGPSGGKGNDVSDGQDGSGTGSGKGGKD